MGRGFAVASVVFVISVCQATSGATWYVDASVPAPGDGTSWEKAFTTIQWGIDAASEGDTVVAAEGTYLENIKFNGKNIVLTSTDPLEPAIVAKTIIDGGESGSVVTFAGTENETCVLSGFTIRNGSANNGGGICGGTPDNPTKATIRSNVIAENRATKAWPDGNGGGIAYCDGLIEHNRILGNAARHGAGLCGSHGTVRNNLIVGNSAELNGGGLMSCGGIIENNTIVRNGAEYGGGLSYCSGTVRNCVIWGNGGGSQSVTSSTPTYSCIGLWMGGGEGNISQYPHFADAARGDFHLKSWSPCIDAGDPTSPFSQEPQPNGGRINIGAYGNTPDATCGSEDTDGDGLPDNWETAFFGNLAQPAEGDPDGDLLSNIEEYRRGLNPASSIVVWYVDASVRVSGDGIAWETAFHTIQEGLDAADDGDTVIVFPGTYLENVEFSGEDVILRSSDPDDPLLVESTVIDGGKSGSVVGFYGTESESCVLTGFTIRNGSAMCGGGIRGDGTRATVRSNTIIGNSAQWAGGGLYGCDGTVEGNRISDNYAFEGGGLAYCGAVVFNNCIIRNTVDAGGGGLYGCSGTIERNQIAENRAFNGAGLAVCDGSIRRNTVTNNSAGGSGGGLYSCNGAVLHNKIRDNFAKEDGGGLAFCGGVIQNNIVAGNSADRGGGLGNCNGTIQNNTIAGNSARSWGSGLFQCGATILNCIIWGNRGGDQLTQCTIPTYSCIQNSSGGGEGNVAYYPYFVDSAHGNYHLLSWSPCIDAGDPTSPYSNEPQPNGGRIDLGAYGNTSEATSRCPDTDSDGLPDDWEIELFGDLTQGPNDDPDGDLILNIDEYRRGLNPGAWHVDSRVILSGDGKSWEKAFKTIQEGIDAASEGETIIAAEGTYVENLQFKGKNIVLRGTDPEDPAVVAATIIDGNQAGSVVALAGTEGQTCVLSGFTIRNGNAETGGGICGGTWESRTHATIENNVIAGNQASGSGGGLYNCDGTIQSNTITSNSAGEYGNGGGLKSCNGLIHNNTITGNSARWYGGGLDGCDGTVQNNTIMGNSASSGGGLYECNGTIQNNTITGNSASSGGGLYECNGTIQNNTITANSAHYGGGLDYCNGTILNNTIRGNSAGDYGGGLYGCDGTIENNTVADNSAWNGGGLSGCTGTIRNCIIWGNRAPEGPQLYNSSLPTYSCIEGWRGGGEGNIPYYPYFVDAPGGDYHLLSWSPCIDAGDPSSDFSNEPQPNGGRIDMGAHGNTPEATSASPDNDEDLLPDDWEKAFFGDLAQGAQDNPDGDSLSNIVEYRLGSHPNLLPRRWYVNGSVLVPGDGTSWEKAFKTIQRGIDAASDGDTVIVAEGTYLENIQFKGKNVLLRSTDPQDPAVVVATVIDGNQAGSVVAFDGTEDETCVLSGFTIRNGGGSDGWGGGINGQGTHATISNDVITANVARPTISGGGNGGGVALCHGIIRNNVICGNSAEYSGGGLVYCNGTIQNNTITGNSADWGGGLHYCNGTIQNNTIANNSAEYGGGLRGCRDSILNCIIWENVGGQLTESSVPTYSCIEGWTGGGEGNISYYPHFVGPPGDYHLLSWSPCIDAGDPTSDFSNEPQPNGGRIDMGAYGNTPETTSASPDSDGDLLPDDWEMAFFGDLAEGAEDNPDGDSLPNVEEYRLGSNPNSPFVLWYVDGSVSAPGDGTSWETAFKKIQQGIDAASHGETVIVAEGTYLENIQFKGKNIVLRSKDPQDPTVVAATVIDGNQAGSVVTFAGTEDETCILSGFTIRNGRAYEGGGIGGNGTHATTSHNIITGNVVYGSMDTGGHGGGLSYCRGLVQNNTITGNRAAWGGGLASCDGTIENNTITGNSAEYGGGGLAWCDGTIRNNTITGNSGSGGGGLYGCGGTIQNNIISGNSATGWGQAGGGLDYCNGTIQNNVIAGNSGSGLSSCSGIIESNTIVSNSGAGASYCSGTIRNCIIWGSAGAQVAGSSVPTYSCIESWAAGGDGNISYDPYLVDAPGGDYHLLSWSPCIDAGDPSSDFSNEPEPNGGRIDMGAYGNTPEATSRSADDADSDGLPDSWELYWFGNLEQDAEGNSDGGVLSNLDQYRNGLNPTVLDHEACNLTGGTWYWTVQNALSEAHNGDEIVVYPGVYRENINFGGKNVVLRGTDPSDPQTVAATVLDGGQVGSVVTFSGPEGEACLLCGFTIRNGRSAVGGGISGKGTRATIETNLITRNGGDEGGGLSGCRGTIQNNTITDNWAEQNGGGLASCGGTIQNNIITGNSARYSGGGGLYACSGTIQNNIITGNSAKYSGGGGLYRCDGTIQSNTITGNSAEYGGGLYQCNGIIRNCIIWANTAGGGPQLYESSVPTYSCIEGWTGDFKKANIAGDPSFAGPDTGDFRLLPSSPCIDAGYNDAALPATDIAGMHRIMYGGNSLTMDMGAYEYYINDLSFAPGADGATLTWSSFFGSTYSIFYSDDLLTWHLAEGTIPSAGFQTTFWIDDGSKTGVAPCVATRRFYRVLENPQ